jgi:hypothetical protein
MRAMAVVGCVGVALAGQAGPAAAAEYKITRENALCIAENAAAYLAGDAQTVLILVSDCPEVVADPAKLAGLATAQSGTDGPALKAGKGDKIIVLTRRQLECLRGQRAMLAEGPKTELVVLRFDGC